MKKNLKKNSQTTHMTQLKGSAVTQTRLNICLKSVYLVNRLILVPVETSEAKDSEESSDSVNSEDSEDIESENDAAEVTLYRWQTIDKKTTKATIELSFNDAIEMCKEEVASLKEHIHIKRRQVNAYREMKASLTDNNLMVLVDFSESYAKRVFW